MDAVRRNNFFSLLLLSLFLFNVIAAPFAAKSVADSRLSIAISAYDIVPVCTAYGIKYKHVPGKNDAHKNNHCVLCYSKIFTHAFAQVSQYDNVFNLLLLFSKSGFAYGNLSLGNNAVIWLFASRAPPSIL